MGNGLSVPGCCLISEMFNSFLLLEQGPSEKWDSCTTFGIKETRISRVLNNCLILWQNSLTHYAQFAQSFECTKYKYNIGIWQKSKNLIKIRVPAIPTASEHSAVVCITNLFSSWIYFSLFIKLFIIPFKGIFSDKTGTFSNRGLNEWN